MRLGAQNLEEQLLVGVMRVIRRRMVTEATRAHGEGRELLLHMARPHTGSQQRRVGGTDEAEYLSCYRFGNLLKERGIQPRGQSNLDWAIFCRDPAIGQRRLYYIVPTDPGLIAWTAGVKKVIYWTRMKRIQGATLSAHRLGAIDT